MGFSNDENTPLEILAVVAGVLRRNANGHWLIALKLSTGIKPCTLCATTEIACTLLALAINIDRFRNISSTARALENFAKARHVDLPWLTWPIALTRAVFGFVLMLPHSSVISIVILVPTLIILSGHRLETIF
jgi:hypothetical protein